MSPATMVNFTSPLMLVLAAAMAGGIIAIALYRRPGLAKSAQVLIGIGLLLLALAVGGLTFWPSVPQRVTVMVDLSPSTRTAAYRDANVLRRRIDQLLGGTPRRIIYFGAENHTTPPIGVRLPDYPAQRTVFETPAGAPVLLFSDVRFELPADGPAAYIAIDPMLEDAPDAAVRQLELGGRTVLATVANSSTTVRQLRFSNSAKARPVGNGVMAVAGEVTADATQITAGLDGTDPWPENDRLTLRTPPPALSQRWWVGGRKPNDQWRQMAPAALPVAEADYLAPSAIVLDNISAGELSDVQQRLLMQYVRDLGGSLVILGGDRAFAAGGYRGSTLETLSPLASTPPQPALHWLLLADSSGSMESREGPSTRWDLAKLALLELLPHLPPQDPVSIGSFAANLSWWSRGKTAGETASLSLPPGQVIPSGPTNLEPAIEDIIANSPDALPKELLILSDADTQITQPMALLAGLKSRNIRLHLLVIGPAGRGLPALRQLADGTGGRMLTELNPRKWTAAVARLFAMVNPDHLQQQPAQVRVLPAAAGVPGGQVRPWNRLWIKPMVEMLADTTTAQGVVPLAARWRLGAGQVLSAAYSPSMPAALAMVKLVEQSPRDPRFKIVWQTGPKLSVSVDAVDGGTFINGLSLGLELTEESTPTGRRQVIPQTGPGVYELAMPAPRQPAFATIRLDGRVLDRMAIAGRYPPEFDGIGNDQRAMHDLASRSGGRVIPPQQTKPIDFHWQRRAMPLTSLLAVGGALFIALGLLEGAWAVYRTAQKAADFAAR